MTPSSKGFLPQSFGVRETAMRWRLGMKQTVQWSDRCCPKSLSHKTLKSIFLRLFFSPPTLHFYNDWLLSCYYMPPTAASSSSSNTLPQFCAARFPSFILRDRSQAWLQFPFLMLLQTLCCSWLWEEHISVPKKNLLRQKIHLSPLSWKKASRKVRIFNDRSVREGSREDLKE